MLARALKEITTSKGVIMEGQIIEIPSSVIDKLKGKVEAIELPQKIVLPIPECIVRVHEELDLAGPWPRNLTAWLEINHREAFLAIREADKRLDFVCENRLDRKLEDALRHYKKAWLDGLNLWNEREAESC
jgi:hypothetical protein